MARPTKEGIDYFPLDVVVDDKFRLIEAQHGLVGFAVLIKLMQKVYMEGYYYEWGEPQQLLFGLDVKLDPEQVCAIVNDCLKWGLFDSKKFEEYGILTSAGIQKRYLQATSKRVEVVIIENYLCLEPDFGRNITLEKVSSSRNPSSGGVSSSRNSQAEVVSDGRSTQSKVKESKVKNSKDIYTSDSDEIVDFLNLTAGTRYKKNSAKTRTLVQARLNEGFTLDDFKVVIQKKSDEWLGTDMEKFIRPETLFGTKFEGYLNQKNGSSKKKVDPEELTGDDLINYQNNQEWKNRSYMKDDGEWVL